MMSTPLLALTLSIVFAPGTSPHKLSSDGCGRATGYAEANKIVTLRDRTHVAWIDSRDGKFRVCARTLDRDTGRWSSTVTIDDAHDNHGGPALAAGPRGHLFVAYYPHHHPMRVRRSLRANDISQWSEAEEVGERTTYPTLVCGRDGTLYLSCRVSHDDRPWEARLFRRSPAGVWQDPVVLLEAGARGYAHFQEALAWGPDGRTLHLSCRIFDGEPRRGHTVGYLQSEDGGDTWFTSDGKEVALPATAATVSRIAHAASGDGVGLRCATLAVDGKNRPHVIYSSYDELPTRAWLATARDDGSWNKLDLGKLLEGDLANWGVNLPGGLVFDTQGRLHVVLTLMRPTDLRDTTIWGHPTSEIVYLRADDPSTPPSPSSWSVKLLTDMEPARPRWLPSIERPTGHHSVVWPSLAYTDGGRGEHNRQIVSNDVLWLELPGRAEAE